MMFSKMTKLAFALYALTTMTICGAQAAPVSVDGSIGPEWTGASFVSVAYDPGAPLGNFGTPGNTNHAAAYDIYTRGDSDYLYVGVVTTGSYGGGLDFANLYFGTPSLGSTIGFEVANEDAFVPGVPGSYPYTVADDIHFSVAPGVVEFAAAWEVFTDNTLGLSPAPSFTDIVQLRLSQSFGYSVAGGASYGPGRLGIVNIPVPEPSSMLLGGLSGLSCLCARRRNAA